MFLQRPEVACLVVDALQRGVELGYYYLRAFVVMGNHVHWSSAWQGGELKFAAAR